ncbi:alpha/beta fold hydrolase [Ammoniphilus sp. 3BR4]|uniref:alpha/beta fold hydrolase n=1 Tax=Ammoniphilus sp. 3BR4 TaxID=3158265 RepID=UPI003466823A
MGSEVYFERHPCCNPSPKCTFVLIHGFLANTFCFRKLIPSLRQHYDVYALDLIGFGKSGKPCDFEYSYRNYGLMIIEFITRLGLRNVVLLGHSMGGQIALYVAKQSPELIAKLVLVSSSAYLHKASRLAILASYIPFTRLGVKWWIGRHKVEDVLETTFYNKAHITEQMIRAYAEPAQEDGFCDTLIGLLRHREGDMIIDDLGNIKHPCLLIWGAEDQIVPLRKGVHLRQDLPNSTLVSFAEAGHQVIEEKPQEVFDAIQTWLSGSV